MVMGNTDSFVPLAKEVFPTKAVVQATAPTAAQRWTEGVRMRKIVCWTLEIIEWILLLPLIVVMFPLAVIENLLYRLCCENAEHKTDQERREYYGYDKGR